MDCVRQQRRGCGASGKTPSAAKAYNRMPPLQPVSEFKSRFGLGRCHCVRNRKEGAAPALWTIKSVGGPPAVTVSGRMRRWRNLSLRVPTVENTEDTKRQAGLTELDPLCAFCALYGGFVTRNGARPSDRLSWRAAPGRGRRPRRRPPERQRWRRRSAGRWRSRRTAASSSTG